MVGSWRLVATGGWRRLVAGGWWRLVVGGWWRLVVDGSWRLAVGGPLGRSLRAILSKKKNLVPLGHPCPWHFNACALAPLARARVGILQWEDVLVGALPGLVMHGSAVGRLARVGGTCEGREGLRTRAPGGYSGSSASLALCYRGLFFLALVGGASEGGPVGLGGVPHPHVEVRNGSAAAQGQQEGMGAGAQPVDKLESCQQLAGCLPCKGSQQQVACTKQSLASHK